MSRISTARTPATPHHERQNEDILFDDALREFEGTVPHMEVGHLFATEAKYERKQPLATHKLWWWNNKEDIEVVEVFFLAF